LTLFTLMYSRHPISTLFPYTTLFRSYGYFKESLVSIELAGKEGQEQIAKCIDGLRNDALKEMNGVKVITSFDYKLSKEVNNLTRSEEHTSELQSRFDLVCRLLLEKKN